MRSAHDATTAYRRASIDSDPLLTRKTGSPKSFGYLRYLTLGILLFAFLSNTACAQNTASTSSSISTISASSSASSTSSAYASPSSSGSTRLFTIPAFPYNITLPALNSSYPSIQITIPSTSASSLYLTLNICSLGQNSSILPQAILSQTSPLSFLLGRTVFNPSSGGISSPNKKSRNGDIYSLTWNQGFANFTSTNEDGTSFSGASLLLALEVDGNGNPGSGSVTSSNGDIIVSIGVSPTGPLQYVSPSFLRLGDTTQNSVLLFSPLLQSAPQIQPTYPNYTLPPAELPLPIYTQGNQPDLTTLSTELALIIVPTGSSPTNNNLDNSLCAVQAANTSTGSIAETGNMLLNATTSWTAIDGAEGFRTMWVIGGLVAATNYTAWMVDDQGGISYPIWFSTKESTFPCQIVLPNFLCPGIGYAAPVNANESTAILSDSTEAFPLPITTYPTQINELITSSLNAFSSSLLSSACGRDLFSHVSTCLDCYSAYRDWLCRIAVPQCGTSRNNTAANVIPQTAIRTTDEPRLNDIDPPYAYTELLPCLSTCNKADRACPVFLQFRCPRRKTTAEYSYAFLGEDKKLNDGSEATGYPALDQWGNRWCNG